MVCYFHVVGRCVKILFCFTPETSGCNIISCARAASERDLIVSGARFINSLLFHTTLLRRESVILTILTGYI